MKRTITIFLISLFYISTIFAQQWSETGALAATGSRTYLTAATNIGDNIFAVSLEQVLVHSSDKGENWSAPMNTLPTGTIAFLKGINDYLYASVKVNSNDFELHYSLDKGATWTIDTIGLKQNIINTGKLSMKLEYVGNDYIIAYNGGDAFYKKLGDTDWTTTTIDIEILSVTYTSNNWLAIGANKILESTDSGDSWNEISTSGLPNDFQGALITSNDNDRVFLSDAASSGADDIYFSNDDGKSWTLQNSAGHHTHSSPWISSLYAVDDYIFASIRPQLFQIDTMPYLVSSTNDPNFEIGDPSGLPTGIITAALPFFFHSNNKLFSLATKLYVSEPGFSGNVTSINNFEYNSNKISVSPNPTSSEITIHLPEGHDYSNINILDSFGHIITEQAVLQSTSLHFNLANLNQGIYMIHITDKQGNTSLQKIVKN